MENVYALVKRFYLAHGRANIFVARTLVERYLRAAAMKTSVQTGTALRTFSQLFSGAMIRLRGSSSASTTSRSSSAMRMRILTDVRSSDMQRIILRACAPF